MVFYLHCTEYLSLSKIIQNISFRYTRYFNKKTNRIDHLFQGRFKALVLDADNYLLQLIRYIHLNPLRANMVVNLLDYPWSSHLAYLGESKIFWLTKQSVFSLLAHDKNHETIAYQEFIFNQAHDPNMNFSQSLQKSFPAICDDQFMQEIMLLQKIDNQMIKITLRKTGSGLHNCTFHPFIVNDIHTIN